MMSKKCTKCGKEFSPENEGESKSLCNECQHKRKKRNIVIASLVGLGIIGIGGYIYLSHPMEIFGGVEEVSVEEPEFMIDLSQMLAINSPISINGTVDNLESFKKLFSQSIETAKKDKSKSIVIPSIGILFDKNSSSLIDTELIKEFSSAYAQTNKNAHIKIEGYACDLGSDDYNMVLSKDRAEMVKDYLVSLGVPTDKILVKSYGEEQYGKLGLQTREQHRRVNVSIE